MCYDFIRERRKRNLTFPTITRRQRSPSQESEKKKRNASQRTHLGGGAFPTYTPMAFPHFGISRENDMDNNLFSLFESCIDCIFHPWAVFEYSLNYVRIIIDLGKSARHELWPHSVTKYQTLLHTVVNHWLYFMIYHFYIISFII